ncbi:dTDP-4-dehydrorhamnose 3,5-epimerase [Sphingomonas alba]|uniref:dTDP-4-dehydrorhamnose 3,5-epimerase n=1 Tax=Sphingomonas alba TaxID=2908208 RepID=A0ABT0RIJ1_9SPHN|nr:dTDP-4-dehydrorhamnose 3,5-epimerase [Sphingomonas alba]MCL6682436.1 dTDP-4-dehydrorhamnose 3,5-epimerase [Sphingomonas alba]
MLEVRPLGLDGVVEIRPVRHGDDRGFFSEVWNQRDFAAAGIDVAFVQDNHSLSREPGVLRGLHYQAPPFAQDKLIRVSRGAVFDVAVDIRKGSQTFGQWASIILSAAEWNQMFVPAGFAHGFLALEPDTEVQYKVSAPYSREHDRAIRFDDPAIGIEWPIDRAALILSDKDRAAPLLAEIETGS